MQRLVFMLLCSVAVSWPARSAEPGPAGGGEVLPSRLSLEEALALLRTRSLDALLAEAAEEQAAGDAEAAGALPNPQASFGAGRSFGYDPSACSGCSAIGWSAGLSDQNLLSDLVSGKRGLRRSSALAALEAARSSRKDALRVLEQALKQALLDLALARAQVDAVRELKGFADQTLALNETRLKAGAASEADTARAGVAVLEAERALDAGEQQLQAARLVVGQKLGLRAPEDLEAAGGLLDARLPDALAKLTGDDLIPQALAARPDLQVQVHQEERAQAALDLAGRQRIPDVAVSAQLNGQGTGQDALQPTTLSVGLSLPLPVLYQQQGELARARADKKTQAATRRKLVLQVATDVRQGLASLAAARSMVERMQGRQLAQARRARDLVQLQFEKGAASLLELLDAQRAWAQTSLEFLQDLHRLWSAVFQLELAVGRELHP